MPNDDFLCLFDESAREEPATLNGAWEDVFAQHHHANAPQGGAGGGFHQGSEDAGEHFPQSGYVDTVQYKLPTTRPGVASTSRGRVTKSRSGTRTSGSRKPKPRVSTVTTTPASDDGSDTSADVTDDVPFAGGQAEVFEVQRRVPPRQVWALRGARLVERVTTASLPRWTPGGRVCRRGF